MTVKRQRTHRRGRGFCRAGLAAAAAAALAATLPASPAAAAQDQLVSNPSAELGQGMPGWTGTPGYTATRYGTTGEFPPETVSESVGPRGGGEWFFDPGSEPAAQLTQVIPLSRGVRERVARGELNQLAISAWLGGYADSPDTVSVEVTPVNAARAPLAFPTRVSGPSAADRRGTTTLLRRTGYAPLPPNTASVSVWLVATGQPGQQNHGYADDVTIRPIYRPDAPPTNGFGVGPLPEFTYPAPMVRFDTRPGPTATRRAGRTILNPRITIRCPRYRNASCAARLVARSSGGAVIATTRLRLAIRQSVRPTLVLSKRAAASLDRGPLKTTIAIAAQLYETQSQEPPALRSTTRAQRPTTIRQPR